jgi:hypothetical protein
MPTLQIQLIGQLLLLGRMRHFERYMLSTLPKGFLLILSMVHSLLAKFILAIPLLIDTQKRYILVSQAHFLPLIWIPYERKFKKSIEKVIINFKKSGNHNSSFTKEAMKALQKETDPDAESVQSSIHSGIVAIYLWLCLNERPGLTNFVSHQLPDEIQVDSMVGPGAAEVAKRESASENSRLRKSQDILAD